MRSDGAWLLRDEQVLAAVWDRPTGSWAELAEGVVLLHGRRLLQTLTHGAALDVARCRPLPDRAEGAWRVERIRALGARRLCVVPRASTTVVVARRGAFERWGLQVGDEIFVRGE